MYKGGVEYYTHVMRRCQRLALYVSLHEVSEVSSNDYRHQIAYIDQLRTLLSNLDEVRVGFFRRLESH